jgi:hypothetical protein
VLTATPMRFLVTGLVLVFLGIAVTEYSRRHPETAGLAEPAMDGGSPSASRPSTGSGPNRQGRPAHELLAIEVPDAPVSESMDEFQALMSLASPTSRPDDARQVLPLKPILQAGRFAVRSLQAGDGFAAVVLEQKGERALVRVSLDSPPRVLVVRKRPVSALAVNGERVLWAEGARVYAVDGGGAAVAVVAFAHAEVVGLAARGDALLVALSPKDQDPFASEPTSAVARVHADGTVTLVADEQVRPHDLLTDGREVYWVAGYPSGLMRAALDGAFSARIVDRADGPLAFDADGLVFRVPHATGSELRHTAKAGGNGRAVSGADADWVAASLDSVVYTTTGIAPRLYSVEGSTQPRELMRVPGTPRGLSASGASLYLAAMAEDGASSVWAR